MIEEAQKDRRGIGGTAMLLFAVFCMSTAIIFLKKSALSPAAVSGYRLVGAALLMTPLFVSRWRRHRETFSPRSLRYCLLPGLALALHFISWVVGLRLTYSANATLAVNMVPVVLPFFLFVMVKEKLRASEAVGTLVAMAGLAVMGVGDYRVGPESLKGDLICILSMLLLAIYFAFGRLNMRFFPSVWLYVVPLYYVAGVICMVVAVWIDRGERMVLPAGMEWAWVAGLILVPTVLGHSLVNAALKHQRGQVVGIFNQAQFIFAGVMAYWIFNEKPGWTFYIASVLMVVGVLIAVRARVE